MLVQLAGGQERFRAKGAGRELIDQAGQLLRAPGRIACAQPGLCPVVPGEVAARIDGERLGEGIDRRRVLAATVEVDQPALLPEHGVAVPELVERRQGGRCIRAVRRGDNHLEKPVDCLRLAERALGRRPGVQQLGPVGSKSGQLEQPGRYLHDAGVIAAPLGDGAD
ncbi:hypothetical protein HRbin26_01144 [bacterium HR26]|nr:hypothetical protein HRbin26_01144 [bacterium HR26]